MSEALPADLGQKPELLWVDIDKIRVDRNYQRDIRANRVAQILREFTWAHFQPVMLAEQPDGTFTVFDGQHRVAAARAHPLIDQVPAAVVRLEASCEEAGAFLGVNTNRTAVSTVEKYHAGIEAGNADMMAVCSVLDEAGCEVIAALGVKPAANKTAAVTAIQRAIRTYGDAAVTEACRTLVAAWPKDTGALHGVMIQALARLYRNNRNIISRERMTTKLHSKDRRILTADAETIRKIGGGRCGAERLQGALRGLQQGPADEPDPDRGADMSEIVGACLSQFHDDPGRFELLIAFADGREIGHVVSRATAQKIAVDFANEFAADTLPPVDHVAGGDDAERLEDLRLAAKSIRTYMPETLPAGEDGKIHFARALAESAAEAIEAFLATTENKP